MTAEPIEDKKFWRSKTFWLGVAIIIGGIAEYVSELPAGASFSTIAAGILGIIIRFLTNQPVSK